MAEAPFSYRWNVTPIGGDYQIALTITQVTSDSVSLLAPARAWTFATCDSNTLTDNILIHNPSHTAITLTNVSVAVPGVNTTVVNYSPVVAAGTSGTIQVSGTRLSNSAVGQGTIAISATYRAANQNTLVYSFNPDAFIFDPFPIGQGFEQAYVLKPARLISNTVGYYRLSIGQPALLNWIHLSPASLGPTWLTINSEITVTLAATAPAWLAEHQPYTDQARVHLIHTDTGRDRSGILYLEATRSGGQVQLRTHFELEPVDELELPLETVGTIEAKVVQCSGGGGGGGGDEPVTGGGSGGWDWWPLPDGGLVGTVTASSIASIGSGGSGGLSQPFTTATGTPAEVSGDASQEISLELGQNLLLAGESVRASLILENRFPDQPIDNISVDLRIRDANGDNATGRFSIEPAPPTGLGSMPGGGQVIGEWLIRPSLALTASESFQVKATISYVFQGQLRSFTTLPQAFTVQPAPELVIDYTLPDARLTCTTFDLRARLHNVGAGTARNISLATGQPHVTSENGTNQGFRIVAVAVDGQPLSNLALNLDLGDLPPGSTREVVWRLRANQPGRFTGFSSDYRMLNSQGHLLAPQLRAINTMFASPSDPFEYGCRTGTFDVSGWVRDEEGNPITSTTFLVATGAITRIITPTIDVTGQYTLSGLTAGVTSIITPVAKSEVFNPTFPTGQPAFLPTAKKFTFDPPSRAVSYATPAAYFTGKNLIKVTQPVKDAVFTTDEARIVRAEVNDSLIKEQTQVWAVFSYWSKMVTDQVPHREFLPLTYVSTDDANHKHIYEVSWTPMYPGKVSITGIVKGPNPDDTDFDSTEITLNFIPGPVPPPPTISIACCLQGGPMVTLFG